MKQKLEIIFLGTDQKYLTLKHQLSDLMQVIIKTWLQNQKMFLKIIQNKFRIAAALSIAIGLASCYLYFQSRKKQKSFQLQIKAINSQILTEKNSFQDRNQSLIKKPSSIYAEFYFDKNLEIRKVLDRLQKEEASVQTIYLYSPLIIVDDYRKLTAEISRRRRLIRTFNQDQYIRLILDYEHQIDQLLEGSREEILKQCEFESGEFQKLKIVFEATQDLSTLLRNAKKSLQEMRLPKKRLIPEAEFSKIINQQVSFIRSKLYERLKNKLQNDFGESEDSILKVIQTLLDDIIYEKYGYEREEIENMIDKFKLDHCKELKQLKKARAQLENQIGTISLEDGSSEEQSGKDLKFGNSGITQSGANSSFISELEGEN